MQFSIKSIFHHHLSRLLLVTEKIPDELFKEQLAPDMFSLADNAKIAANFALRGYCPLINKSVISFETKGTNKESVQKCIRETISYLDDLREVTTLNSQETISDDAGFTKVKLSQPQFIHQYILPNLLFHMCMVYAVARNNNVNLSKEDFDGLHKYPDNFSFVDKL